MALPKRVLERLVNKIQRNIMRGPAVNEARQKVVKWQKRAEIILRKTMHSFGYRQGLNASYVRTGGYLKATHITGVRVIGTSVVGQVGYTDYMLPSIFGRESVNIPELFESGYQVTKECFILRRPRMAHKAGRAIMQMAANTVADLAAGDGVIITFNK